MSRAELARLFFLIVFKRREVAKEPEKWDEKPREFTEIGGELYAQE